MHLLISDEFLMALRAMPGDQGDLWGSRSDRGSVVRLVEPKDHTGLTRLGQWVRQQPGDTEIPQISVENCFQAG